MRLRLRGRLTVMTICGAAIVGLLAPRPSPSSVLYNDSASVPLGFWVLAGHRPCLGAVIAFRPPPAAMRYVAAQMPAYARRKSILKYVVALTGDRICRAGDVFSVNGRALGLAASRDEQGHALPAWTGCRTLLAGEVAVFSDRIPNSFDSRYYEAIPAVDIAGVYRPLWTW